MNNHLSGTEPRKDLSVKLGGKEGEQADKSGSSLQLFRGGNTMAQKRLWKATRLPCLEPPAIPKC